jgi:hypothetical protein
MAMAIPAWFIREAIREATSTSTFSGRLVMDGQSLSLSVTQQGTIGVLLSHAVLMAESSWPGTVMPQGVMIYT